MALFSDKPRIGCVSKWPKNVGSIYKIEPAEKIKKGSVLALLPFHYSAGLLCYATSSQIFLDLGGDFRRPFVDEVA